MNRLKEKWNKLNLSVRVLVPLFFVITLSFTIGGFVTIPLDMSFRKAIKLANPFLSPMEIDYLVENSEIAESKSSSSPLSETFLTDFTNSIVIDKSILKSYLNAPLDFSKTITYLFGLPLYTSSAFKPSLDNYMLLASSSEGLGLSEKLASLKENPNIEYVFIEDSNNNEYLLLHANSISITKNQTSSTVLEKIKKLEIIDEKNYPTLKDLSNYTFRNSFIESYFAKEFILNLRKQTTPITFLEFGFYSTYDKGKKKLNDTKDDLIISLTIGFVGLVCFSLVSGYIVYIYLQAKKRRIHE